MKQGWTLRCTAVILGALATQFAYADADIGVVLDGSDFRFDQVEEHLLAEGQTGQTGQTPQALRTLGLMKLYGERLYGREVARDCAFAKNAVQKAAAMGDPEATFIVSKGMGGCQAKVGTAGHGS